MAIRFSKKVWKQGMSFQLSAIKDAYQHLVLHPTSLPQEQAAKTDMLSVVSKCCVQLRRVWLMLAYDCPCPHEAGKYYTCGIERGWHIYIRNPFTQG